MKTNRFLSYLFISFFSISANAQSVNVGGIFPTVDLSGSLNAKLDYGLYYFAAVPLVNFEHPNFSKDANFNLFYSEQSLSYKLNSNLSFTGSYVFQRSNVLSDNYTNENRFYLQSKYKQNFKSFELSHRLRFDGRFIQDRITKSAPFTHRVRYQLGVSKPITENLYFTAYEEAFFNTYKNADVVFGENWSYAAIGKNLNENNKLEAGVLFVTWNTGPKSWFNQYYFQATWISHLAFKQNRKTK